MNFSSDPQLAEIVCRVREFEAASPGTHEKVLAPKFVDTLPASAVRILAVSNVESVIWDARRDRQRKIEAEADLAWFAAEARRESVEATKREREEREERERKDREFEALKRKSRERNEERDRKEREEKQARRPEYAGWWLDPGSYPGDVILGFPTVRFSPHTVNGRARHDLLYGHILSKYGEVSKQERDAQIRAQEDLNEDFDDWSKGKWHRDSPQWTADDPYIGRISQWLIAWSQLNDLSGVDTEHVLQAWGKYDALAAHQMRTLIDHIEQRTRIEVTQELLSSVFALGDNVRVTWGEATVAQHEQRITLLLKNAEGNIDTAKRHQAAVEMITEAGVDTLADLASFEDGQEGTP